MKRVIAPLAAAMVLLYLALAAGAAGCLVAHSEQPDRTHHHTTHAAHSALCAWVCQAKPAAALLPAAPSAIILELIAIMLLLGSALRTNLLPVATRSRAPPF